MLVRLLALALLLLVLWRLFRAAMGLRFAKLSREQARRAAEASGRRVVAEIPTEDDVVFFIEDEAGFAWGGESVARGEIAGARLLLNGGVVANAAGPGVTLPDPAPEAEDEGRERWEVALYLRDGATRRVRCGSFREGVSREIARQVFEAVRRAVPQDRP